MGGGRIDCYLDIASLYSYIGFEDLWPNLDKLAGHGVEVESVAPSPCETHLVMVMVPLGRDVPDKCKKAFIFSC
ncbi:hypothetical protein E4U55_007148 [Claviceps digitariae]|nr:hypothetical protein E4U55_007148 [Claviceps digitariae]